VTGPIDEDETDSFDFKRPAGPSPREVRAEWARNGEVEPLWRLLADSPWDRIDREDVLRLLAQALEVQGRADPARFAADVMGRMTVLVTTLLMRCHLHLAACVEQDGRAVRLRAQPPGDLPRVAVEALIPRTLELQEHLASLFVAQAGIARQWSLVKKNQAGATGAGDAEPSKGPGGRRKKKAQDGPPAAQANGHASNRLAGLLNGHGPGRDGGHADG